MPARTTATVAAGAGLRVAPLAGRRRRRRVDALAGRRRRGACSRPAHQFPLGVDARAARAAPRWSRWAAATGGLIIEDDYDGEFRYDRQPVGALQGLAPDHVVYAGTASKTLAPGPAPRLAGAPGAARRARFSQAKRRRRRRAGRSSSSRSPS